MALAGGRTSQVESGPARDGEKISALAVEVEPDGQGSEDASGIGICLSGGGIRAAAFGLGALQMLDQRGILRRSDYLAAVSGGSYIVGAMNLVQSGPGAGEKAVDGNRVVFPTKEIPVFSHGSPEEKHLRHNLDYLISGPGGLTAVLAHAAYGFLLNILFLGLTIWVPSLLLGWLYGWAIPGLRYKESCSDATPCVSGFHASAGVWAAACVIGGLGILAGLLWVGLPMRRPLTIKYVSRASYVLVSLALVIVVVGIGIPYLVEYMRGTGSTAIGDPVHSQSTATINSTSPLGLAALAGLVGLLVTTVAQVRRVLLPSADKTGPSRVQMFAAKHKGLLFSTIAAVSVPLFALGSSILVINWGAAHPPFALGAGSPWAALAWGVVPLIGWLALVSVADVNTWSFHPYYKQHLSRAFALARVDGGEGAAERVPEVGYKLSKSQPPPKFPHFLICATANIDDRPNVPTGFKALPFVFSAETVEIPGFSPVKTAKYEERAEYRITMPTAMAVSGAAFSPEMGAMTRRPLRMLMTLANIRLGVWLPNPNREPPERKRDDGPLRLLWFYICHWYFKAPRPFYLFAELLGRMCVNSRYLYVTDGGHYDNLGLVELLRKRCTCIICVDASGDKIDSFGTIGKALAIARAENLIKSFDLDPRRDLAPPPETPRFVRSSYCFGTVEYNDGLPCELVVIKAGVTADAPWDIRAYQESEPDFPTDPTLDQFYKAPRFDAYRALGEYSTARAVDSRLAQPGTSLLRPPGSEPAPDGPRDAPVGVSVSNPV
jgi:Lysophospholipase catalytic domain